MYRCECSECRCAVCVNVDVGVGVWVGNMYRGVVLCVSGGCGWVKVVRSGWVGLGEVEVVELDWRGRHLMSQPLAHQVQDESRAGEGYADDVIRRTYPRSDFDRKGVDGQSA